MSIEVHVRLRPQDPTTVAWSTADTILYNVAQPNTRYVFNKVHPLQNTTNKSIFGGVEPLVLAGFANMQHVCVMAYGPTGSGKTHSMTGTKEDAGIIQRTARLLIKLVSTHPGTSLGASFIEVYNECVRDLLDPGKSNGDLTLQDTPDGSVRLDKKVARIESLEDFLSLQKIAEHHRRYGVTDLNTHSSRSHIMISFEVHRRRRLPLPPSSSEGKKDEEEEEKGGSTSTSTATSNTNNSEAPTVVHFIHLVDLAGAECAGKARTEGQSLREGGFINKSLLALGNVVDALVEGRAHVPYRDAKLTRLLRSALSGSGGYTFILCCIHPGRENVEQTTASLRFTQRAMRMKQDPVVVLPIPPLFTHQYASAVESLLAVSSQFAQGAYQRGLRDTFMYCDPTVLSITQQMQTDLGVTLRALAGMQRLLLAHDHAEALDRIGQWYHQLQCVTSQYDDVRASRETTQQNLQLLQKDVVRKEEMLKEEETVLRNFLSHPNHSLTSWEVKLKEAKQLHITPAQLLVLKEEESRLRVIYEWCVCAEKIAHECLHKHQLLSLLNHGGEIRTKQEEGSEEGNSLSSTSPPLISLPDDWRENSSWELQWREKIGKERRAVVELETARGILQERRAIMEATTTSQKNYYSCSEDDKEEDEKRKRCREVATADEEEKEDEKEEGSSGSSGNRNTPPPPPSLSSLDDRITALTLEEQRLRRLVLFNTHRYSLRRLRSSNSIDDCSLSLSNSNSFHGSPVMLEIPNHHHPARARRRMEGEKRGGGEEETDENDKMEDHPSSSHGVSPVSTPPGVPRPPCHAYPQEKQTKDDYRVDEEEVGERGGEREEEYSHWDHGKEQYRCHRYREGESEVSPYGGGRGNTSNNPWARQTAPVLNTTKSNNNNPTPVSPSSSSAMHAGEGSHHCAPSTPPSPPPAPSSSPSSCSPSSSPSLSRTQPTAALPSSSDTPRGILLPASRRISSPSPLPFSHPLRAKPRDENASATSRQLDSLSSCHRISYKSPLPPSSMNTCGTPQPYSGSIHHLHRSPSSTSRSHSTTAYPKTQYGSASQRERRLRSGSNSSATSSHHSTSSSVADGGGSTSRRRSPTYGKQQQRATSRMGRRDSIEGGSLQRKGVEQPTSHSSLSSSSAGYYSSLFSSSSSSSSYLPLRSGQNTAQASLQLIQDLKSSISRHTSSSSGSGTSLIPGGTLPTPVHLYRQGTDNRTGSRNPSQDREHSSSTSDHQDHRDYSDHNSSSMYHHHSPPLCLRQSEKDAVVVGTRSASRSRSNSAAGDGSVGDPRRIRKRSSNENNSIHTTNWDCSPHSSQEMRYPPLPSGLPTRPPISSSSPGLHYNRTVPSRHLSSTQKEEEEEENDSTCIRNVPTSLSILRMNTNVNHHHRSNSNSRTPPSSFHSKDEEQSTGWWRTGQVEKGEEVGKTHKSSSQKRNTANEEEHNRCLYSYHSHSSMQPMQQPQEQQRLDGMLKNFKGSTLHASSPFPSGKENNII